MAKSNTLNISAFFECYLTNCKHMSLYRVFYERIQATCSERSPENARVPRQIKYLYTCMHKNMFRLQRLSALSTLTFKSV